MLTPNYETDSLCLGTLTLLNATQIRESAEKLVASYPIDIDENLMNELLQFQSIAKVQPSKYREVKLLQMFRKNSMVQSAFVNIETALRIYLCMMVTNCSAERSFSALKRIKSNLRSTIGQNRLNALSLLCIENDMVNAIDTNTIIHQFASTKVRKINF